MEIDGAIFDIDGTLCDSLWVWKEIDKRFLNRRGFEVPPDYSKAIDAMNFRLTAEYTIERFKLDETPEALMNEWLDMARDIYAHEIGLKTGAKELLLSLKERGVKLGIATSSYEELYIPLLKNNGVFELFSAVMDTTMTRGKAFPDIYLAVADKMGVEPSRCVVFEDIPLGLKSAKEGGFKTVAVYDRFGDYPEIHSLADKFIMSFDELKF